MTNKWAHLPFPTQQGQVGGHEGVGKIVKMGAGTENAGVKLGDRVGIKWQAAICDACEACRAGADAQCFNGVSTTQRAPFRSISLDEPLSNTKAYSIRAYPF